MKRYNKEINKCKQEKKSAHNNIKHAKHKEDKVFWMKTHT